MTSQSNDQSRGPRPHQQQLLRIVGELAHRHTAWQVFVDFAEAAALAFSNAVDLPQRDARERRYMELIKRYTPEELKKFPAMLGELTLALEDDPSDVLGRTFHDLELHNKWSGQFFSPYSLCRMMARMTLADPEDIRARITTRGFVTTLEPCCGSGAMVIALAHEMKDLGINYQQHLHVTAVDIDVKCVHMAYTQFALLHIPAIVIHGNSLAVEEYSQWYTPAHILGGWSARLRHKFEDHAAHEIRGIPELPRPSRREEKDGQKPEPPAQLALF